LDWEQRPEVAAELEWEQRSEGQVWERCPVLWALAPQAARRKGQEVRQTDGFSYGNQSTTILIQKARVPKIWGPHRLVFVCGVEIPLLGPGKSRALYFSSTPSTAATIPTTENAIPTNQYIRLCVSSVIEVITSPISSSASPRS
jgi:hypothetical protein